MPDIAQLSLRLPAGFETRAARLAGLTARALARHKLPATGEIPALSLPNVRLDPRRSDHALADTLARHIAGGIARGAGAAHGDAQGDLAC